MAGNASIDFFDTQFQRQVQAGDFQLNPFEEMALPYLRGRVLDFGCGLGNLSLAAARQGCSVLALDASPAAIAHVRQAAAAAGLAIEAAEADLRTYRIVGEYDAIVSIGLLMFFDCASAHAQLEALQSHVRPGGIAMLTVMQEGTTFFDMFDRSAGYCVFARGELEQRFRGWEILHCEDRSFPAPRDTVKAFATIVARKPQTAA
jgi:tellurite methyltransferase